MGSVEIVVRCPDCGDEFHTFSTVGEGEVCTVCEDVFHIEESDVVKVGG